MHGVNTKLRAFNCPGKKQRAVARSAGRKTGAVGFIL